MNVARLISFFLCLCLMPYLSTGQTWCAALAKSYVDADTNSFSVESLIANPSSLSSQSRAILLTRFAECRAFRPQLRTLLDSRSREDLLRAALDANPSYSPALCNLAMNVGSKETGRFCRQWFDANTNNSLPHYLIGIEQLKMGHVAEGMRFVISGNAKPHAYYETVFNELAHQSAGCAFTKQEADIAQAEAEVLSMFNILPLGQRVSGLLENKRLVSSLSCSNLIQLSIMCDQLAVSEPHETANVHGFVRVSSAFLNRLKSGCDSMSGNMLDLTSEILARNKLMVRDTKGKLAMPEAWWNETAGFIASTSKRAGK